MKIMIIDDEPDIRDYLMAALEDNGYETCTITDNEPVLEAIQTRKPDLIILDIMMPVRSGVSIYKELRSTHRLKKIPIAIISGMLLENDFKTDFEKLVNDNNIPIPEGFIEKPVKLPVFMKLIHELLK
jgi:CheY-like chemotaxis protein